MKRIKALLLVLCLCAGLCACGGNKGSNLTMDKIKSNLGDDYNITYAGDNALSGYADLLGLNVDDYDVKSSIRAQHKENYTEIMIVECGSPALASKLAKDAKEMVTWLEMYYTSYTFTIKAKGSIMLCGEVNAVKDAIR